MNRLGMLRRKIDTPLARVKVFVDMALHNIDAGLSDDTVDYNNELDSDPALPDFIVQ